MSKANDTILFNEKDDTLQVLINIKSIMTCINAIRQYDASFNAQDILKENDSFSNSLIGTIMDEYTDYLYNLIEENRGTSFRVEPQKVTTDTNDLLDFEPFEIDFKELEL